MDFRSALDAFQASATGSAVSKVPTKMDSTLKRESPRGVVEANFPNKKAKVTPVSELVCAACNVSKCRATCFSSNQRSKGLGVARCKGCIQSMQAAQQAQRLERKTQDAAKHARLKSERKAKKAAQQAQRKAEAERIRLEREAQRRANNTESQSDSDDNSEDSDQYEYPHKSYKEDLLKKFEAEGEKLDIEENEVMKKYKIEHEEFMKKIKEDGFEEETAASSDLVYVVTSIVNLEDPFSPRLHGIYSTREKAIEGCKKAFEDVSRSYHNGRFLPDKNRQMKLDLSEFIRPCVEFRGRIMYEVYDEEGDYTAVAINVVPIDCDLSYEDLPFLKEG